METVLNVEGMMCTHCKAAVERACRAVAGVTEVRVELKEKTVTVFGTADRMSLKAAIEAEGFEVL